jgi:aminocarboxymuconate-semialdehyde decarboxylase
MTESIDVHTHIVPEHFPAYPGAGRDVPWPRMDHFSCDHAHVIVSGRNYRTVTRNCWDMTLRCQEMDALRIGRQVLSPMPELLSYWFPAEDGARMCRYLNEQIQQMISADPARLMGLGAVPLQDLDRAVLELEFILAEAGLCGVEIASHVNGVSIGDARFEPFFAAAESLGAAVFVHALRPAGKDRLVGPAALEQIVAFPGEIGLAAASLITGGMLERHPRLRLALSHGGGALPVMLPRLEHGWRLTPALQEYMPRPPSSYARQLYCDSLTYDPDTLALALRTFGAERVMIGSDYPFNIRDRDPLASIAALNLSPAKQAQLHHFNAQRFLTGA